MFARAAHAVGLLDHAKFLFNRFYVPDFTDAMARFESYSGGQVKLYDAQGVAIYRPGHWSAVEENQRHARHTAATKGGAA